MSDETPSRNNNNKRRRNNNRRRKLSTGNAKQAQKAQGSDTDNNSSASRPGKKKLNNKNRRPKTLTPGRLLLKYENLVEQYLTARKKYFGFFARVSGRQLEKIVKNYETSRKDLHQFEGKLDKDWQKELIQAKNNPYPEDRQYSTNYDLKPEGDDVRVTGGFDDPHLLSTQKSEDWSSDTEESSGNMEDYEKYKEHSKYH